MTKINDKPIDSATGQQHEPGFTLADAKLKDVQTGLKPGFEHPFYILPPQPHEKPPAAPSRVSGFELGAKDVSMCLTRNAKESDVTDKNGQHTHVKQDDAGNSITAYDNGKKIYESKDGNLTTRSERDADGSAIDTYTNSKTKDSATYTYRADGSITVDQDSPTGHVIQEWGPGGKFRRMLQMDKKTGHGTISTLGPDGNLVTSPLIEA